MMQDNSSGREILTSSFTGTSGEQRSADCLRADPLSDEMQWIVASQVEGFGVGLAILAGILLSSFTHKHSEGWNTYIA